MSKSQRKPKSLTPEQRRKYLDERLAYWLAFWQIDPFFTVKLELMQNCAKCHEGEYAEIYLENYKYHRITIRVYETVFGISEDEEFMREADQTLCHEVGHILLYPLTSFAENLLKESKVSPDELTKLEELVVSRIERCLTAQKDTK